MFYDYYKNNFLQDLLEFNFPNYRETTKQLYLRKKDRNPVLINELLDGYHNFFKQIFPEKNIQQIYSDFYEKHFKRKHFCPQNYTIRRNYEILKKLKLMKIKKIPGRVMIHKKDIEQLDGFYPTHLKIYSTNFTTLNFGSVIQPQKTRYLKTLHLEKIKVGGFSCDTIEEFFGHGVKEAVYNLPNLKKLRFTNSCVRPFSVVFPFSKKVESISTSENCKFCDPGLYYNEPLENIKSLTIDHNNLSRSNFFEKKISTIKVTNANYLFLDTCSVDNTLKLFRKAHLSLFNCDKLYIYYDCDENSDDEDSEKSLFDLGDFYEFFATLRLKKLKISPPFEAFTHISNITKLFDIAPTLKISRAFLYCLEEENNYVPKNPHLLQKLDIDIQPITYKAGLFETQADRDYFLEILSSVPKLRIRNHNFITDDDKLYENNSIGELYTCGLLDLHEALVLFQTNIQFYGLRVYLIPTHCEITENDINEFCSFLVSSKIKYLTLIISPSIDLHLSILEMIIMKINEGQKFFKKFKCIMCSNITEYAKNRLYELLLKSNIVPELCYE